MWKDLSAFGYRNNLQRAVPGSVSTLSALSEEAHAGGMQLEYWIIKTIIKVIIVVPVLITSCQVFE